MDFGNGNFLTTSWRPLLMLLFGTMLAARWFGFTAPNLTPEEISAIEELAKYGILGYGGARTAEKLIPNVIAKLKEK